MFYTGQRIKFFEKDAIVLTTMDREVLIFIDERNIKWVDAELVLVSSMTIGEGSLGV